LCNWQGCEIGKNSIIKNNVVIKNSIIGSNVIICDNTSIGTTGFGFDFNTRGSNNLNPQIGIVYIGDNVILVQVALSIEVKLM
jgi:UDP-3-O-[3-hydroxymyristoyl] glucosamine N-acyltransferase